MYRVTESVTTNGATILTVRTAETVYGGLEQCFIAFMCVALIVFVAFLVVKGGENG